MRCPGKAMPLGAIVCGIGAVLAVIGAFIPWETVSLHGASESVAGFEGNGGKIIAVLGIVAAVVAVAWIMEVRLGRPGAILIALGVLILLVGVLNYSNISGDVNSANTILAGAASVGIGLYLDVLAGVVIIVGGALGVRNAA